MEVIKKFIQFVLCVVGVQLIGSLSALLAGDIRGKYEVLNKPPFSPPAELFGLVWPVLYFLIGVALFLVLNSAKQQQRLLKPLLLFMVQLLLNFIWSIVFFGSSSFWLAFVVILVLDISVFWTINAFYHVRPVAGYILIPYLVWILFATYLNIAFAIIN